jgi:Rac GTPase-activating protein 1
MFGNDLVAQCLTESRLVPFLVAKCIEAVEESSLEHEGIYRKTGGMGQTKLISGFFDRGESFELRDQDRFNDISAVTSV